MSKPSVSFLHDSIVVRFPDGHLLSGFYTDECGEVVGEIQQYTGFQEADSVLEKHAEYLHELSTVSAYARYAGVALTKMSAELINLADSS